MKLIKHFEKLLWNVHQEDKHLETINRKEKNTETKQEQVESGKEPIRNLGNKHVISKINI